ncbi:hypothetical protein H310_04794 [Aphanomyces invadans]|uniref:Cystathionine gamma-synthase n=1 Tax=Aphanomyces invadans TaxID=157072 RepID=A0A024UA53_9STRA|nr:hypothetical protein H310_04794 [Aphanomyces invadans]ETW03291.1 hypothetical protein H310_04794 [Aphanomyces invadans]|eukprot:XP_008867520.1 hypothetical protein H310_04794 [Aphanomyces invadans]
MAETLQRCLSVPLGGALPDDVHAVSVSMPEWQHVELYEQGCPELHASLRSGYPRFVYHAYVKAVNEWCWEKYVNDPTKVVYVLPTYAVAKRCEAFLLATFSGPLPLIPLNIAGAVAIVLPVNAVRSFKSFWQHSGEILSSRMALHILQYKDNGDVAGHPHKSMDGTNVHARLRDRVASMYPHITPRDVFLYPCGMAAIFAAFRVVQKLKSTQGRVVLFGFPYLDTLKMMRRIEWSCGNVLFYPNGTSADMDEVDKLDSMAAIFTEFPTNPLLQSADLKRLADIAHRHNTVLVVDDTIGSYNVQVLEAGVDLVATSLTKIFTGAGTAMAGSLVVNSASPWYTTLHNEYASDSYIFEDDCVEILEASKDVCERIHRVNSSASAIASRFATHPQVETVYYPKFVDSAQYSANLTYHSTTADAFGPLMSVVLHGGEPAAKAFYNALGFAKGPSLGTNFTLACPYTLLAHYDELDYVESCGVDRNLIRISIGLEDVDEIWSHMEVALRAAADAAGQENKSHNGHAMGFP